MPPENLTLSVVRPDDLLVLTLDFAHVLVTPPAGGLPGEIAGTGNGRLTVHLQPQHIAERTPSSCPSDRGPKGLSRVRAAASPGGRRGSRSSATAPPPARRG